ncbi:MAG: CDP-diacylglycerol--glycerol-3-phosphate 3-phosphatidyltransferase [Paracoccaceae bacterium]|nr:MAG: CDP-diacylglycerol--glycerol-3-phosphate 3-phosphatidyltransferase [Paracoccaceae bacterium]
MGRNLPNLLTWARILAAPATGLVFLAGQDPAAHGVAFALFTAAGLTDFLDGWLARRLGQESALGRMLDPVADKAMVTIALAALMAVRGPDPWLVLPALAIFLREVLVAGLREHLGAVKLHVTRAAKWKTTAQLVAVGGLLLAGALPGAAWLGPAALALLWLAAGLTVWTGFDYMWRATPYLRGEGR